MHRLFLLALFAVPFTGCDSESDPRDDIQPAPIVTELGITDEGGNFLGPLSAAAIDSTLAAAGPAPLSDPFGVPDFSFLSEEPVDNEPPGEDTEPAIFPNEVRLEALPSPFSRSLRLSVLVQESDRAGLYLLPAVTAEGTAPPEIRAGALSATPEGFDGLVLYEGPSAAVRFFEIEIDPQVLGLDYGVYRIVAFSGDDRDAVDVLYAPCVDGRVAGTNPCR